MSNQTDTGTKSGTATSPAKSSQDADGDDVANIERPVLKAVLLLSVASIGLALATEPPSDRGVLWAVLGIVLIAGLVFLVSPRRLGLSKLIVLVGGVVGLQVRLALGLAYASQTGDVLGSVPPMGPYVIFASVLAMVLFRGRVGVTLAVGSWFLTCAVIAWFFVLSDHAVDGRVKMELIAQYVIAHAMFVYVFYLFGRFRGRLGRYQAEIASLHTMAKTDSLTGLANRRLGEEVLARVAKRNNFASQVLSVILVDLDHFKKINDTHGHDAGDRVLQAAAEVLASGVRPQDTVCRWGGEEFLVVVFGAPLDAASNLAERLRAAISELQVAKIDNIGASFGVATIRDDDDARSIVARADQALYAAKRSGRNRVSAAPFDAMTMVDDDAATATPAP